MPELALRGLRLWRPWRAWPQWRPSRLTRRILAVNLLPLALLLGGVLYLGQYRDRLVESALEGLATEARLIAAALGEGAVAALTDDEVVLNGEAARAMVRRLVETTGTRTRVFAGDGGLLADSRLLLSSGPRLPSEPLSHPGGWSRLTAEVERATDALLRGMAGEAARPPYRETAEPRAAEFPDVQRALAGDTGGSVWAAADSPGQVLTVAAPVQRFKRVLGAVLLSRDSASIDRAVADLRLTIIQLFAVAGAGTVALSLYLAGTIARPIRVLAAAADRVRHGHGRRHDIPDMRGRRDDIGDLSGALRDMTAALWNRLDAIERFAADVAHEIKNPLTSLRSAVETVGRIEDPARQKKLLAIIQDDVARLDRLISDISDASRVDAEMSREEFEPVDLARILRLLKEIHDSTGAARNRLGLDLAAGPLVVPGIEDRLVQVFRNLLANAASFAPEGGMVCVVVRRGERTVTVAVEDDGPGIPPGKEEKIFERFYSERPDGEKFGTHSGLGLAISRQIVQAHGGRIRAENRPQGGARFTVELPLV
ncbi:MAG TPA: stimulus-sensing domain-containing protein [Alphaproteobacteria bacterium]|nr:stimulus-sensing domain-containing protein [Alphaproteobacteria bacterium]